MAYLHHIPGRLRVRSAAVKRDKDCASVLTQMLSGRPGIASVKTNTTTGSILVNYNAATLDAKTLLDLLGEWGFVSETAPPVNRAKPPAAVKSPEATMVRQALARAVIGFAVEKAVERSMMALMAALL